MQYDTVFNVYRAYDFSCVQGGRYLGGNVQQCFHENDVFYSVVSIPMPSN